MNVNGMKRELDEGIQDLKAARRNDDWARVEQNARYVALVARRLRLERDADEAGVVKGQG